MKTPLENHLEESRKGRSSVGGDDFKIQEFGFYVAALCKMLLHQ